MNISEANAVNVVLRHLLGTDRRPITTESLQAASTLLVRSARRALGAGLLEEDVDAAFAEDRVARRPRRRAASTR